VLDAHEKSFLPIRFASQQEMEEDSDGFQLDFRTVFHLVGGNSRALERSARSRRTKRAPYRIQLELIEMKGSNASVVPDLYRAQGLM
jgi:hypothetical protein